MMPIRNVGHNIQLTPQADAIAAAVKALRRCGRVEADSFGDGLFELRLKGFDGIARVFFCALVGRRIMMLHSFIKKSQKTPHKELEIARRRMREVKNANP